MKRTLLANTTAALLLAIATAPAMAADPDVPERGPMPFDGMDADHDGYVSQEEYRHAHSERMQKRSEEQGRYQYRNMDEAPRHADIDTDGDGRVSREEFQAHQQQRMQQRAQERSDRQQKRETRQQEMMERHQERVEEMQQKRLETPAGGMGPGGGMGGGKR
jgi:hypothetical protein